MTPIPTSYRTRDPSTRAFIESGRYPTPLRLLLSVALSVVGLYTPGRYAWIARVTNWLWIIPPLGLLAH